MRLRLDENLSESVLPALTDLYPDPLHVRMLGAGGASDERVRPLLGICVHLFSTL
ncbi:MAG: DUF5615 family PIN-like protein [Nitrospiraceae bacterium]|nr:DUF5615 family PIN-like protein [Nitrospiraceae bacterium]